MIKKNSGKIKERNIDPDLLIKLSTNGSIDLSSTLANYMKKNEKITQDMLDKNFLDNMRNELNDIIMNIENTYRKKDIYIQELDLDPILLNKIQSILAELLQIKERISGFDYSSSITDIKQNISEIKAAIQKYNSDFSALLEEKITTVTSLITNNTGNIDTLFDNFDIIQNTYRKKNEEITENDVDNKIKAALKKIESFQQSNFSLPGFNIGEIATVIDQMGNITGSKICFYGAICNNQEEVVLAKANQEDMILDLARNILFKKIVNSDEANIISYFPSEEDIAAGNIAQALLNNHEVANKFLLDKISKRFYLNHNGTMILIYNPVKNMIETGTINADQSIIIDPKVIFHKEICSPYDIYINFLVKDLDSTSKTFDQFINGESLITIAYNDENITLHNKTNKSIIYKLIMQNIHGQ